MTKQFDVLIIGASIAGSSLALRLGRRGIKVALIDKAKFPREKPCGEGLAPLGLREFSELGILPEILTLPHCKFDGFRLVHNGRSANLRFSPGDFGVGVERRLLDNRMLEIALNECMVEGFFGEQVRDVCLTPQPVLTLAGAALSAPLLVLADGANSLLAGKLEIPVLGNKSDRFGCTFHLTTRRIPEPLVTIITRKHNEVYITPIAERALNVSLLGSPSDMRIVHSREMQAELLRFVGDQLGEPVQLSRPPIATGPLGRMRRQVFFGPVLLIGDVCESLDPIGGMGMTHAALCARLAEKAIRAALSGQSFDVAKHFQHYSLERELAVRSLRGFTRVIFHGLRKGLNPVTLRLLDHGSAAALLEDALLGATGLWARGTRVILQTAGSSTC